MFVDFFTKFLFSHFWQLKVSETTSLEFSFRQNLTIKKTPTISQCFISGFKKKNVA